MTGVRPRCGVGALGWLEVKVVSVTGRVPSVPAEGEARGVAVRVWMEHRDLPLIQVSDLKAYCYES